MKRITFLVLAVLMLLSSFSFTGCVKTESESNVLRVCNCEDYIDETLLDDFYKETGIEVVYSTYGTNENLYNELVINPNSYDLVVPSEYMIEKLAEEGRIQPIDFSKIAKIAEDNGNDNDYDNSISPYIKDRLKSLEIKRGDNIGKNLYDFMVGYMWGTMGWVYNTEYVTEEEVSSWDGVFYNPNLSKKITIKDSVRDSYIVGLAMTYKDELKNATTNEQITEILNRTQIENINAVGEKLSSLKPMLYGFEVDSGKNDIILGNIYAYVAWSGDAAYAIDVASGEVEDEDGNTITEDKIRTLSYSIPEEGSNIWFDGFVMPSGSTNQENAYKFLEFISRPENVIRNMDYTGYTSMIATDEIYEEIVIGWFDESEDLDENEGKTVDLSYLFGGNAGDYEVVVSEESYGRLIAQYPEEKIVAKCAIMGNFDGDTLMTINDMWEGVKSEKFATWLILLVVALVVLIALTVIIFRNREKWKWLNPDPNSLTKMEKKGYKRIKVENINQQFNLVKIEKKNQNGNKVEI